MTENFNRLYRDGDRGGSQQFFEGTVVNYFAKKQKFKCQFLLKRS